MTHWFAAPLACAVLGAALVAPAFAQPSPEQRAAMKQKWDAMSPEEKAAARAKLKEKWDSMSPEEQAAARKRFAERHPGAAARRAEPRGPAASAPAGR